LDKLAVLATSVFETDITKHTIKIFCSILAAGGLKTGAVLALTKWELHLGC
jgi:hypothetical protein